MREGDFELEEFVCDSREEMMPMRKVVLSVALLPMFVLSTAGSKVQQAQQKIEPPAGWKKCISSDGVFYAPSCPTTARVTKLQKSIIDVPGYTVEDYDTCMQRGKDWPEGELREWLKRTCKQGEDLRVESGSAPGYYPGHKSPGYIVTFETPTAVYIASAQARCGNLKSDGTCDFSGGPGVVVGDTYIFTPPTGDSTDITLAEKENGTTYVRLSGNMDSVTEKAAEKTKP